LAGSLDSIHQLHIPHRLGTRTPPFSYDSRETHCFSTYYFTSDVACRYASLIAATGALAFWPEVGIRRGTQDRPKPYKKKIPDLHHVRTTY